MAAQSKGKVTVKSWQLLPPEIVRHIVTFTLLDVSATAFIPRVWERQDHWLPRMSYTVIRDAKLLEKFMSICTSWGRALETHLFWQHANAVLDPHDVLLQHGRLPARLTPFRHFWYNIYNRSCIPCRINSAVNSYGLCQARRAVRTFALGNAPCCKDHRKDRFCGVCLSDQDMFIAENEDHETFAGVESTCRECRSEWLLGACRTPIEREAISSSDWETQDRVRAFIQLGELSIRETIQFAMEKLWLKNNTKYSDMLSQAVAASKFQRRRDVGSSSSMIYESEEEDPDAEGEVEELSEEEEVPDLIHLDENGQRVRELAVNDWVRNRILDGHWFSPGDQFQRLRTQGINRAWGVVPAAHPCPWNRSPEDIAFDTEPHPGADAEQGSELDDVWADMGHLELEGRIHPQLAMAKSEVPDSEVLINYAKLAYQRNMRSILFPAMVNIVQKVVIECTMEGRDFFQVLSRYDMEDVARELRDENVWYNGIDWVDRRRQENYRREREAEEKDRERTQAVRDQREDQDRGQDRDRDDTSSSSKSEASHSTSPVLSTSTLQTTPSPPPAEKKEYLQIPSPIREEEAEAIERQDQKREQQQQLANRLKPSGLGGRLSIPISPVLANPTLLPSIPFIPVTLAYMPEQTMATFKSIWMEVCAPVFQCNCSVCTREAWKAVEALGHVALAAAAHLNPQEVSLEPASMDDQAAIMQPMIVPSSDVDQTSSDGGYENFIYPQSIPKSSFGGIGGEDLEEVEMEGEDENGNEDEGEMQPYELVAFPEDFNPRRQSYNVDDKGKGKARQIDHRAVTPEDESTTRDTMKDLLAFGEEDDKPSLLLSMPTTPRKRVVSGTKRSSSELEDDDDEGGRRNPSVDSEGSTRSKRAKTEDRVGFALLRLSTELSRAIEQTGRSYK